MEVFCMWGWHGLLVWKVVHVILKAMDYRHTGVQWEATAIVQDREADGSDWGGIVKNWDVFGLS